MAATPESKDPVGGPPSSLSAPVSACHSPLAPSSSGQPTRFPVPATAEAAGIENGLAASKKESSRKRSSFARLREHARKMKEKLNAKKGKGGKEKMMRELFGVSEEEKLMESCKCSLSTTAGPILGNLFISTEKVGFYSERSIALHSSTHGIIRTPYKVCIPLKKIKMANEREYESNPAVHEKFIGIVTHDNYEFWFMVFRRSKEAFITLQKAISMST